MRARCTAGGLVAGLLLVACGPGDADREATTDPVEEQPATTAPVQPPPHDDWGARFDPARFGPESATIDNPFWPHEPGMQFTYEGEALDGDETIERRIVATVTDLTKVVAGVRVRVVWERDYDDGVQVEGELSFRAQDTEGNLWHLGEYTEVFEDEEYIGSRVWVPGDPEGAQAGLMMPAESVLDGPSFSQGFAPPPWNWDDRGRLREVVDEVCVEAGCYSDVLVVEEFEPSVPDAFQLKYYARGVGHVQVGWEGANETEREELQLVEAVALTPEALDEARTQALAMEDRATAYGRLEPAQPIGGTAG